MQYASVEGCIDTLKDLPYVRANGDFGANATGCRLQNVLLVPYAPAYHCPAVGPSGGNICVDKTLSQHDQWFAGVPFVTGNIKF